MQMKKNFMVFMSFNLFVIFSIIFARIFYPGYAAYFGVFSALLFLIIKLIFEYINIKKINKKG
jgi:hypothetical protein